MQYIFCPGVHVCLMTVLLQRCNLHGTLKLLQSVSEDKPVISPKPASASAAPAAATDLDDKPRSRWGQQPAGGGVKPPVMAVERSRWESDDVARSALGQLSLEETASQMEGTVHPHVHWVLHVHVHVYSIFSGVSCALYS